MRAINWIDLLIPFFSMNSNSELNLNQELFRMMPLILLAWFPRMGIDFVVRGQFILLPFVQSSNRIWRIDYVNILFSLENNKRSIWACYIQMVILIKLCERGMLKIKREKLNCWIERSATKPSEKNISLNVPAKSLQNMLSSMQKFSIYLWWKVAKTIYLGWQIPEQNFW